MNRPLALHLPSRDFGVSSGGQRLGRWWVSTPVSPRSVTAKGRVLIKLGFQAMRQNTSCCLVFFLLKTQGERVAHDLCRQRRTLSTLPSWKSTLSIRLCTPHSRSEQEPEQPGPLLLLRPGSSHFRLQGSCTDL